MGKWISKDELNIADAITNHVGDTDVTGTLLCTVDPLVVAVDAVVTAATLNTANKIVLQYKVAGSWVDLALSSDVSGAGTVSLALHPNDASPKVIRDAIRVIVRGGNTSDSMTLSHVIVSRMT